jgi:DNA primase
MALLMNDKLKFIKNFLGDCKYSSNTKEAEFRCPSCNHHKNKLSINIETDIYHCWVCNKSGTLLSLLRELNASSSQISEYIKSHKPKNIILKKELVNQYAISLPKEYQPLVNSKNSFMCKKAFEYLKKRNIPDELILRHKFGYCTSGDFANRIIIPSFDKFGNLNFYTGRDISGLSTLSYLNDRLMPKGYKNTIVINELNVDFSQPVVLVEGFFDMFNSVPNTVPLCGSTLNKESTLFKALANNNTDVILALDPDAFYKKTLQIAKLMLSYGLNVYSVDFRPHKDLGSMNKIEGISRIENALEIDRSFLLKSKMKGLFND